MHSSGAKGRAIGLLHPGEMGAEVGATLVSAGHTVYWIPIGRSKESTSRAEAAGLTPVADLDELTAKSEIVLSIVPPHAALDVAREIAGRAKFFVDCNAVSPQTAIEIESVIVSKGSTFVDGGIVGPPPFKAGTTRLYLSGELAGEVSQLFESTRLEAPVLPGGAGVASGFKNCYAAWTKGSDALLLAILSVARELGVEENLRQEWNRSKPELTARLHGAGWAAARKGWRWVGEMLEIAKTFQGANMPTGFHRAAAEIFDRSPHDPKANKDEDAVTFVVNGLTNSKAWDGEKK